MAKSQQLEVVLSSKAFSGSPKRTYLHESTMGGLDYVVVTVLCALLVTALWLRFSVGLGRFALPAL